MITTRPLLPEALTAAWIELYWHFLASFLLVVSSDWASAAEIFTFGCVDRST